MKSNWISIKTHWQPLDSSSSAIIHWINQVLTLWYVITKAEEGAGNYKVKEKKKKTFFSLHCIWNFPVEKNKGMKQTAIDQIQLIYCFICQWPTPTIKTVVKELHQASLLTRPKQQWCYSTLYILIAYLYYLRYFSDVSHSFMRKTKLTILH